jgi:hypothetical protein
LLNKVTEPSESRLTLKEWLAEHARAEAIHYKKIAEALERDPASVSASLSIERKQAQEGNRPPYFIRTAPGLYRYNDLCEGAIDEDLIVEVRARADEFNLATRREMRQAIARLDMDGFEKLAKIILTNIRARYEDTNVIYRNERSVVMLTSWLDDGGHSPVVVYAKKCALDVPIGREIISEIRGILPTVSANQGVLISNGIVSKEGKNEALGYAVNDVKVSVPPVHIMDIDIVLNILFESRTGVRFRSVDVFLLDEEFFDQLSESD